MNFLSKARLKFFSWTTIINYLQISQKWVLFLQGVWDQMDLTTAMVQDTVFLYQNNKEKNEMKFTCPTRSSHLLVSLLNMNSRNILDWKGRKLGEIVQVNDNQLMVLKEGHNLNMNTFRSNVNRVNRPLSNSSRFLVNKFGVGSSVVQWDPSWISNMSGVGQGPRPRLSTREQGPIRGCRHLGSVQKPPVKRMTDTHDWKHYLRATS